MKSFDSSVATDEVPSIFMIYYPVREKIDPVIYLQVMQKLGSDLQGLLFLLLCEFWCTETYFLLQNRNLKFCQKKLSAPPGLRPA